LGGKDRKTQSLNSISLGREKPPKSKRRGLAGKGSEVKGEEKGGKGKRTKKKKLTAVTCSGDKERKLW